MKVEILLRTLLANGDPQAVDAKEETYREVIDYIKKFNKFAL